MKRGGNRVDMVGQRYGRLTVIRAVASPTQKDWHGAWWECRCDCGRRVTAPRRHLIRGDRRSCGCKRHGRRRTPEYRIWLNMVQRCTNPRNPGWPNYGGRGITLCERWRQFENFYADMGPRPSVRHSIERDDNDGPYAKENCRWATRVEQANNRRDNLRLTVGGRTQTAAQWERELGLTLNSISRRVAAGMSATQAIDPRRRTEKLVTIRGHAQPLTAWLREKRIHVATYYSRLKRGWSVERALTEPVRKEFRPRRAVA